MTILSACCSQVPSTLRSAGPRTFAAGLVVSCLVVSPVLSEPIEIVDADGRTVAVEDRSRIVSVGGSVTEILYALGLQDRIVAVDTTSLFPPEALGEKPNVGYMRALSPEGVLSLDPSLILAEEGAGPPEAIALLESASVPFVLVPNRADAEGIAEKIRFVARAMDVEAEGDEIAASVTRDLADVTAAAGKVEPRKVLFVLSLTGGRILAAGEDTSAAAMIALAGADNALSGFSGYKPVNDEAVIEAAPDVVVMMARGDHAASPEEVFAHPALAHTPAADGHSLVVMDGLYLLGFGPRTAHAARDLAAAIYPDAPPPGLPQRPWTSKAGAGAGQ